MAYQLGKKVTDDGIWKEYNGADFLIARAGTVEHLKVQEDLEKPYRKKIDKGTLSVKIKRDINLTTIARAILLDWKGVESEDGKGIAYSEELGKQVLMDDPDVLEFIMDIALDNDNFSLDRATKIAKKSSKQ